MIQYPWFDVHYTMLLPNNLLDTTMTAPWVLIIFMIIIHEFTTVMQAGSVKSLSVSAM